MIAVTLTLQRAGDRMQSRPTSTWRLIKSG
jgi:hypothetical protein